MINWYLIGDINTLKADERPRFNSGIIIDGSTPEILTSNAINEYGNQIEEKLTVIFKGAILPLPEDASKVYVTRDDKYGLRVVGNDLQIGVNQNA
ncbi:hypothetical protein NVP1190O_17 [Vibrio phage 1.190.O._10N.286.51.F12]|nr:hypothetical protein NVP1190O_17 [Vibrio phage 1.190.O._10N.286.51.F12]